MPSRSTRYKQARRPSSNLSSMTTDTAELPSNRIIEEIASTAEATQNRQDCASSMVIDDQRAVDHHQEERGEYEDKAENHYKLGHENNHDHTDHSEDINWASSQQFINDIAEEAEIHGKVGDLADEMNASSLTTVTGTDDAWLRQCQQTQDAKFKDQRHLKHQQGIWELDLTHNRHECYNAYLFKSLRPSPLEERNLPAPILGYGTVELKVHYDKSSTQWNILSLENVAYIQARQDSNHRVGLEALPNGIHLLLPPPAMFGDQGDGFLSIATGIGCPLGQINQGGRKAWKLRTLDPQETTKTKAAAPTFGFLLGWGSSHSKDSRKRQREDDNDGNNEVRELPFLWF